MAGYYLSEDLARFGEIGESAGKMIAHSAQTQNTFARKR